MLEMAQRISYIGLEQTIRRPQVQAANVKQARNHRGAAAMHADDANYPSLGDFHDLVGYLTWDSPVDNTGRK